MTTVGRDRRVVTVVAGLGALAIVGSLLAEWAVTTVPGASPDGRRPLDVPQTVNEVGSIGTAYLVGVSALSCCIALVLFGTPSVRRNLRVCGLTLAAGLLVLLGALTATLAQMMNRYFFSGAETLVVQYGRGLLLAFVGVATLGAALALAARPPGPPTDDPADDGGERPEEDAGWPWRRLATGGRPEWAEAPADLTVTPTQPFAGPHAESPPAGAQPQERRGTAAPGEAERYRRESPSGPR